MSLPWHQNLEHIIIIHSAMKTLDLTIVVIYLCKMFS